MILAKPYSKQDYIDFVAYCNKNGCTIKDNGAYIESVATVIPLDEIKQSKIEELKHQRDAEEQTPIAYSGYRWDFDDKAIQRINSAIIALSNGGSITWTSADNEEIQNVNVDDLRGVVSASAVRSNELHIKYRNLREQVERANSVDAVQAISW